MAITDLIPIPKNINQGLSSARQITMLSLLGNPRGNYDKDCQPMTNPNLKKLMVTKNVGPFKATGLSPAIDSLILVMKDIQTEVPEVYAGIGTAGMFCARFVRGSTTSISNHSWGTAIDLNLNGQLDLRGNNKVQKGLAQIAPIFNRHQWYWGAGFPKEDAMHFELSDQKIRSLHAAGAFGGGQTTVPTADLTIGDRGQEVKLLQQSLNKFGSKLVTDGDFGRGTLAAVMAFQAANGLTVDGIVGPRTRKALGM
jgi:hypothetical protein